MKRKILFLLLFIINSSGCEKDPVEQNILAAKAPLPSSVSTPEYVGKESCSECHVRETELFKDSHHDLAMQHANANTILGDFNDVTFSYNGITSSFFKQENGFFVNTDGSDGKLQDFKIAYVFGVEPLQQYLIKFPGGRLQALSIAWDSRSADEGGQRWYNLYPDEDIDHQDELHWTSVNHNWNYMCAECHSTDLKKNFDLASNSYNTTWSEIDVSCEACHGPGSKHVSMASSLSESDLANSSTKGLAIDFSSVTAGTWVFKDDENIASLSEKRSTDLLIETCGRCHSRRSTIDSKEIYSKSLHDTHLISLLEPGLYHADGQINEEVYVYGSFIQSKMYIAGVNCNNCHDPHSLNLRIEGNTLCLQCHKQEVYDDQSHHFHLADTKASECVSCHMPAKNFMVVDARRDHSFRIPRPDLSIKTGSPNACNQCHIDQSPEWAMASIQERHKKDAFEFHYGEALHAARTASIDSEALLLTVINDEQENVIARASALNELGRYLSRTSFHSVLNALSSDEPLIRWASLNALSSLEANERFQLVNSLLDDPIASVRINAARILAPIANSNLPAKQRRQLDKAIQEYIDTQIENSDRGYSHVNLGNLYTEIKNFNKAEAAYKKGIAIESNFLPAYTNLADLYRQQKKESQAEDTLRLALNISPDNSAVHHALGLALVRQKKYDDALSNLERAAQLDMDNAQFSLVYAIALNSLEQTKRALGALAEIHEKQPANRNILMTLSTMHRDAGNITSALSYAEKLSELSPNNVQIQQLVNSLRELLNSE